MEEENRTLRATVEQDTDEFEYGDLESGEDKIELFGSRDELENYKYIKVDWSAEVSWNLLLRHIGPALLSEADEDQLHKMLSQYGKLTPTSRQVSNQKLYLGSWNEVLIQLRALGWIDKGVKKRGVNDKARYWRLTPKGDKVLVKLLARRRGKASGLEEFGSEPQGAPS